MFDLTIDFETFFSQEYSLGKITTQEYLLDSQFEVIGASLIEEDEEPFWLDGPDLPEYFKRVDWSNTNMIGHNLIFDGSVLATHFNHRPKLYSCTLSYARAILGALIPKCDLAHVAATMGMRKDRQALFNLRGMHYADVIRPEHATAWERYKQYAVDDAVQSRAAYKLLQPSMPPGERVVVDIIIRMFTEGKLVLDPQKLKEALYDAKSESAAKLAAAGVLDVATLRSRDTFAGLLRDIGVEPPMKVSPANGELTYAFAKDDLAFVELLEHEDPRVRTLVEAKINAASTILESRAQRLTSIANLTGDHQLWVPIAYSGAHTHRFSGLDKLNLQNIPKSLPGKPSKMRYAIRAPKGYKLIVRDASQIEARILAVVAGQHDLVQQFANGEDVYSSFASEVYGREINKKDDPIERFIGKTGILGLGYGSGPGTFLHMVLTSDMPTGIDYDFAQEVVTTYRRRYWRIQAYWRSAQNVLRQMLQGQLARFGPCTVELNRLRLPSGLYLTYPGLRSVKSDTGFDLEWSYFKPKYKGYTKIFGAKVVENIVQALARIQISDTMLKMRVTNPDWHCALQVHDELVYVAPDSEAEECDLYLSTFMNSQPTWAYGYSHPLPLANEGGIGEVYGDIKQ